MRVLRRRIKTIQVKKSYITPGSAYIVVPGRAGQYEIGEAVRLIFSDCKRVGCVSAFLGAGLMPNRVGHWSIQYRTVAEGSDPPCLCRPPLVDDFCAYPHYPDEES